jgi:hypothetical protein
MINHCVNILRLNQRNSKDFKALLSKHIKDAKDLDKDHLFRGDICLDFHSILPMPKELRTSWRPLEVACEDPTKSDHEIDKLEVKIREENLNDFGFESPEDWAQENWGTEFNCYDFHFDPPHNSVIFDTANTPPLQIVIELAKELGEDLKLFFIEPGAGLYGEMVASKTGETQLIQYDEENIPKEFDEEFPQNFPEESRTNISPKYHLPTKSDASKKEEAGVKKPKSASKAKNNIISIN